jgi:apoptosis-inducing factor 3
MEMASVLSKLAKEVTVVGEEKVPFGNILGSQIGSAFQKLHDLNRVKFELETKVSRFEPATNGKQVGQVVLANGKKLKADLVVLGVGVRPQTDYIKGKLPLELDGSILVDNHLRVVSAPKGNVYAAGDIACIAGGFRVEHWNVAHQQGRIAGRNLASQSKACYESVPFFWTMQFGKSIRFTGSNRGYDDVIIRGDLETYVFEAFYISKQIL